MSRDEFLIDYGLYCGNMAIEDDRVVSPMDYISEFCEMCWVPTRAQAENFLILFYAQYDVDDFLDSIIWRDEDDDYDPEEEI
jgi:hypothetical protein